MKTWAFSGLAVSVALLGACGAASSSGGTTTGAGTGGSHTTTVSASHSSSGTATTTSGGGSGTTGDPCSSGADCTTCPDQMSCISCAETAHPTGAMLLNNLLNCIFCTACYTVCESSQTAGLCMSAPTSKDPCDMGTPGMPGSGGCGDANSGCAHCSQQMGASCYSANQACSMSMDCVAFDQAIQACPTM